MERTLFNIDTNKYGSSIKIVNNFSDRREKMDELEAVANIREQ